MDTDLVKADVIIVIQNWNTRRATVFLTVFQFACSGHQGHFAPLLAVVPESSREGAPGWRLGENLIAEILRNQATKDEIGLGVRRG